MATIKQIKNMGSDAGVISASEYQQAEVISASEIDALKEKARWIIENGPNAVERELVRLMQREQRL